MLGITGVGKGGDILSPIQNSGEDKERDYNLSGMSRICGELVQYGYRMLVVKFGPSHNTHPTDRYSF